jgi:hypothetical protein
MNGKYDVSSFDENKQNIAVGLYLKNVKKKTRRIHSPTEDSAAVLATERSSQA